MTHKNYVICCSNLTYILLVGASQKKVGTRKMKKLCEENENFIRQHYSPLQDACLCTIWAHLNK